MVFSNDDIVVLRKTNKKQKTSTSARGNAGMPKTGHVHDI